MSFLAAVKQRIAQSRVARGVLALGSAAALGQIISIVLAPLLTRIYDPAAYGALAVFTAIVSLVAMLSTLRYELAIPLPEEHHEARTLVRLCLYLSAFTAVLSVTVWAILGDSIAEALGAPALKSWAVLVGLGVFVGAAYATLSTWAVRARAYGLIARTRLAQSVGGVATSVVLGALGAGPVGLLAGNVVNSTAGTLSLARLYGLDRRTVPAADSPSSLTACAKRYRRFPIYSTWHAILGAAGQYAPALMISAFLGASAAGHYGLATRLCLLPVVVLGQSMSQVFFGEAATMRADRRRLAEVTEKAAGWLAAISIPAFGVLLAFGPAIFATLLGSEWSTAGLFSQLMAPWLAVSTVSTSLSFLPMILERQAAAAAYAICDAAIRVSALVVATFTDKPWVAVATLSAASAVSCVYYLFWCLRLAHARSLRFLGHAGACVVASSVPILVALALTWGRNPWVSLAGAAAAAVVALALSCTLYHLLSKRTGRDARASGGPTRSSGEWPR